MLPPKDRSASKRVEENPQLISDDEVAELVRLDVEARTSPIINERIRSPDGIDLGTGQGNRLYFTGLDARWGTWFNQTSSLNERIIEELENPESPWYNDGAGPALAERARLQEWDFTRLDWPTLGRGIATAVLHFCHGESWLTSDQSAELWVGIEIHNYIQDGANYVSLTENQWLPDLTVNDAIANLLEKKIDPVADLSRVNDGPYTPMFRQGGQTMVNPLAIETRKRIYVRRRSRGHGSPPDMRSIIGVCVLEVIDDALDTLQENPVDFALTMHGLSAFIMSRSRLFSAKIGMHLFSMLGIRRELRGVQFIDIPSLHRDISSNLPILRCLEVVNEFSITRLYSIDPEQLNVNP